MRSRRAILASAAALLLGLLAEVFGPTAAPALTPQDAEAMHRELKQLSASRRAEVDASGSVLGEVEREREFQSRMRATFRRYGGDPDAFQEAIWAYRLAVFERLEGGELNKTQAGALIAEYRARIVAEGERLRLLQIQAVFDMAARAMYLSQVSQSMNAISQAMQQQQQQLQHQQQLRDQLQQQRGLIFCNTQYSGQMAYTTCR